MLQVLLAQEAPIWSVDGVVDTIGPMLQSQDRIRASIDGRHERLDKG